MLAIRIANQWAESWRKPKITPAIFILQFSPLQRHLTCKLLLKLFSYSISSWGIRQVLFVNNIFAEIFAYNIT